MRRALRDVSALPSSVPRGGAVRAGARAGKIGEGAAIAGGDGRSPGLRALLRHADGEPHVAWRPAAARVAREPPLCLDAAAAARGHVRARTMPRRRVVASS